jgi:hypothetical protein
LCIAINIIETTLAKRRLRSSFIPNLNAALKPISDQRNGMNKIIIESLFVENNSIPKVKMVVGQGRPNVGEEGYICPRQ